MSPQADCPKCNLTNDLPKAENQGAAVGAAANAETAAIDPGLQAVVAAWPGLPEALRSGIVAMVQAAGQKGEG